MSTMQKSPNTAVVQNGSTIARHEQQILDTSSIGVLITRISDGTILYANKAITALMGLTDTASVIGMPVPDFYWDPGVRKAILERFRVEGCITNNEIRARRADGGMRWASISIHPFNFEGEQVLLSEVVDITDRKQAEEALKASEERFHTIYENVTIGLYRTTPDGRILMLNPTGVRMLGYDSFEEIAKRNLEETGFEKDDARKGFREKLERKGSIIGFESSWEKKDGSTIFVRESAKVFRDENGKILYYDGSFEDITEHKQAEAALHASEERFRRFTEVTVEALVFHEQGRIIDANPAGLAMFGMSQNSDFVGRNLMEFVVPESHKLVLQQMQLETVKPYEIQCIREDGSIFPVETSTRTYKVGGRTIRASSIRDITETKRTEQALRESQQLLQIVMDNIPLSIFWKDAQLNYIGCNRAFAADVGYASPGDVIGKSDYDMPSADRAEHYRADDNLVITSGIPKINFEEPQTTPDGSTNWLRTSKIPMRGDDEKVFAILGIYEDITEQKRLQQRVQDLFERRGFQVQISTEISQEIASASEISDLFSRVVTLTKEHLGYYHTQLLRYDDARDAVVLINGYGEIGQKMLAGGHQLPMGVGLIGTAAATGETVMRTNLADDTDWKPNSLLPETKGEIAVPIKWQNTILGVLDVQSNQADALSDEDRLLLEGLCGQIAIAMHSAELVKTVRQNEARLAEALKTARLANWEYDVEKDIFTFNDQFYSIFHTTAEKVGGYQLSSARYAELFVYPDDMEMVGTEIGKALSSTERVYNTTLDHRILYQDGGVGYITVQVTVERDEDGKITRYYGANQDITERKRAETALAEALKTARLANWEYDVEKDIFTFNDQFYSIFHTTAEKVGGYQLSSARYAELFVYPDDMEMVGTEIGKALSSTERVYNTTLDHRILYQDGGVGYITVQVTVERDEDGKITRYYGANQDITERKQAEEALRRNEQEMAERLEEVNRLYLSMSQEGWKTYRETTDLPAGFIYDQAGLRTLNEDVPTDELFANIPMKVPGGEVVGTLTVEDDPLNPTSDEDRAFLQQVSDQIALAMESARLAAQTQTALAQSENLFESSRRLSQAADLQELVKATIETLNIPAINRAVLGTFSYNAEDELEGMTVAANWWNGIGTEVDAVGKYYSAADLQVLSMFLSPTPLFFNDIFHDERVDPATLQVAKSLNICSAAILPLLLGTHQLGIVLVESEEPYEFTQDEIRLYSALAPQIATMLENRRQFERAQKQAERESTLNVISQKIQSATTVEAVLQIAARELGHALGAPMTIAQLSMKDKN